jgi:hypothetical protein
MQIIRFKTQYLPTTVLIVVGVLVWVLASAGLAAAGPYTDSAHGNTTYGVNRSDVVPDPDHPDAYDIGSCAHCHDTFDPSICGVEELMLFYESYISKSDMLCFQCHRSGDIGYGEVDNYPYCVSFGGYPAYYDSIRKQFTNDNSKPANRGSRHNLARVQFVIKNDKNGWGFDSNPNACFACHPAHAAQRNHPVAVDGEGKLNTAIRRVLHYKSTDPADLVWGDDANERMSSYAASNGAIYQAPYYGDITGTRFEPTGNASPSDGSNLPDYVTFCLDCHGIEQYDPDNDRTVKAIDWSSATGDRHGLYPANNCTPAALYEGTLKPPYDTYEPNESNFVLSCLDCHEPHGARKRMHLIRRMINGGEVANESGYPQEYWKKICDRCHNYDHSLADCGTCHDGADENNEFHGGYWGGAACNGAPMF